MAMQEAAEMMAWEQRPEYQRKAPGAAGWLAGANMRTFQLLDRRERIDLCLQSLATIFSLDKEQLRQELTDIQILDWSGAPHIRGGYSYETVGAGDVRARLLQPVEQTIWFAGEALYEGIAPGTVEAAFTSGLLSSLFQSTSGLKSERR